MKEVKITEILADLESGLTRMKRDDYGKGSIQEKYDLSINEVIELFQDPKLQYRKTKRVGRGFSFILIDDTLPEAPKQEENSVSETGEDMLIRTQEAVQQFISGKEE